MSEENYQVSTSGTGWLQRVKLTWKTDLEVKWSGATDV